MRTAKLSPSECLRRVSPGRRIPGVVGVRRLVSACLALVLCGCASTRVEHTGQTSARSVCQTPGQPVSALVLWGPQWRPDQKDVPDREEAARRGLEAFFADSGCYSAAPVVLRQAGRDLTDRNGVLLANTFQPRPDRVLIVTVRELGPVVRLLASPALVEGGTEVVLDIRAVDVETGVSLADFKTHWHHGGAFFIRGVGTLAHDMNAALRAALRPGSAGP